MRVYICCILFVTILASKNSAVGQTPPPPVLCTGFEIQENKTALKTALQILGKEDLLYKTYACGPSSGYVIQLYMFKKLGLAITSKTGLVDKIEILDTLKLAHYDDGVEVLLSPTLENIINFFGPPEQKLNTGLAIELYYQKKGIRFIIDSNSKKLIKLIIAADGVCIQNRGCETDIGSKQIN